MIPGAGLYLPETLYANQEGTPKRTETQPVKHKFIERKSTSQHMDNHFNSSRVSVALSRKSSEDVTRVFSSLSTVFDFADYASSSDKVTSDSEVFINLLQRVRQDVTEASRLYVSQPVSDYFDSWPDKKTWIDSILVDIQRALNDIGVYMETVRISGDDSGVTGLRRRFEWVLSHQKKLFSKQQNLMVCHQSLTNAVHVMLTVEVNAAFSGQDPVYEAPIRPWVQDESRDILRSPHSRQKWRLSQRNLSLPSITVSESGGDKCEVKSVDSAPIELPGSTPDDLPLPDNWDLYAPPPKPRSASMDGLPLEKVSAQPPSRPDVAIANDILGSGRTKADALVNPQVNAVPLRRSLDQFRPLVTSTSQRSTSLINQARPRAFSDQIAPPGSFVVRPRASLDQVQPLPTLKEKPLERYDSNATVLSVTEASQITLPIIRQQPKAVTVRKPPVKHRSLPLSLPSLSSQTSLMDDLSNWVIPASARNSYISNGSPISANTSTPSTSVTSSPVLSNLSTPCPGIMQGFGVDAISPAPIPTNKPANESQMVRDSPTMISVQPSSPAGAPPPAPQSASSNPVIRDFETTSGSVKVPEIKLPTPKLPEKAMEDIQSNLDGHTKVEKSDGSADVQFTVEPGKTQPQQTANTAISLPATKVDARMGSRAISVPETAGDIMPRITGNTTFDKSAPELEQQDATATTSDETNSTKPIEAESAKPATPITSLTQLAPSSPRTSSYSEPAAPSTAPTKSSRPMTAQAKRRAAHERRMRLAYGKERNKAEGGGEAETNAAQ